MTDDHIVWQEYNGKTQVIRYRSLDGGQTTDFIQGGAHPSPWNDLIAWTDWRGDNVRLHVTRLNGEEIYSVNHAIFPNLCNDLVAYLRRRDDGGHSLLLDDIKSGMNAYELPWVGFPVGSGPSISDGKIYFESRAGSDVHAIWETTAQMTPE